MRVLVVEDSETMRKIIVRSLHAIGVIDVLEATDGMEAIQLYKSQSPDIVLTDWNMPNMDGLQLVRELRSHGIQVPIIMITTEVQESQVNAAMNAGCNDYITKPVDPDFLREKLNKHVSNTWNGTLRHVMLQPPTPVNN